MIEESYVSFETARLLKEAGFDVPCDNYYDKDGFFRGDFKAYMCPTQALAARWLREVKNIHIQIYCTSESEWGYMADIIGDCDEPIYEDSKFPTYERAMEVGLEEVLEWICRKR